MTTAEPRARRHPRVNLTVGGNQFSAVVGCGDASVGTLIAVPNNSHATFVTAVYIHACKAADDADACPSSTNSTSSRR